MGQPYRLPFQHHAGPYRPILPREEDLSQPWQSTPASANWLPLSPLKPVFDLPKASPPVSPIGSPTSTFVVINNSPKKRGIWQAILELLHLSSRKPARDIIIPAIAPVPPITGSSSKVQPHEWKEYGYWARPILNRVECCNSPVTSEKSIGTDDLKEFITNLRDPDDPQVTHSEHWIPGLKHPALPPRPSRWKDPIPGDPLPFPWEVQINPLLQHLLWGPTPLSWYIGTDPRKSLYYGRTHDDLPCWGADLAQPATWPFLTHMYFNAVAGDGAPVFPWPFTVYNPRGIKVGDVLDKIYENFHQPVTPDEAASWPFLKQQVAKTTHSVRLGFRREYEILPVEDVMRRYDSLGGTMYFRGIEATIDGGGWMITFGTY